MQTEDYIAALEKLKTKNEEVGFGIMQILGALKAEIYKAKKMPGKPGQKIWLR